MIVVIVVGLVSALNRIVCTRGTDRDIRGAEYV